MLTPWRRLRVVAQAIVVVIFILLFPGATLYGEEDEEKPVLPVPPEYANKHMPDGFWTNPQVIAKGEKIYQEGVEITTPEGTKEIQRCAQCHGASGKPKLKGARDFRQPERMNKFSDSFWFWRISEGVPDTKMPAWKGLLTEEQRWQVMAYEHMFSHAGKAELHGHPEIAAVVQGTPQAPRQSRMFSLGDAEKGQQIFFDPESKAPCAKCHTIGGKGGKVGPELTGIAARRSPDSLIQSILDPSAEIVEGYEAYLVVTKDQEFITGILAEESDSSITIEDTEGEKRKIPREAITKMVKQKKSIMPDNFRELLTAGEFFDLLRFLLSQKK
jgi:putative heme-binding domain-containing protein